MKGIKQQMEEAEFSTETLGVEKLAEMLIDLSINKVDDKKAMSMFLGFYGFEQFVNKFKEFHKLDCTDDELIEIIKKCYDVEVGDKLICITTKPTNNE